MRFACVNLAATLALLLLTGAASAALPATAAPPVTARDVTRPTEPAVPGPPEPLAPLRVRGDWNYPPFEFVNSQGAPDGFNVDIVRAVARVMHLEIDFRLGPWEEVRRQLEEGRIDVLAGMFRTPERDRLVDFTIPHLVVSYAVFVRDGSPVQSLADLADKIILVQSGDLGHDYVVEHRLGATVIPFRDWGEVLAALARGRGDGAIVSRLQGMHQIRQQGLANIHPVGPPLLQRKYCIATAEGNSELLFALNEGLSIIKTTGEYDRIYEKWFPVYEDRSRAAREVLTAAAWVALPLAALAVLALAWNRALRRQVVARTRDLQEELRMRREAEEKRRRLEDQLLRAEKMETLGTLAGGVAHDLNNVLGAVVGYPDLLLDDLPPESPLREPLTAIKDSGEKASLIVQDLLTLARRSVPTSEVVDVNRVIQDHLDSLAHRKLLQLHPGTAVNLGLAEALLPVKGSPVHLGKVVMNLLINAVEAMPQGGEVRLTTANVYLDRALPGYDTVAEGDYVVLTVEDHGVGMSATDLKHLFEPFYTKKAMGRSGSGLGMAVVWGAVKDHHGYIDVQSRPGHGTRVAVYLPVTREPASRREADAVLPDLRGRGERILVVDDVASQRRLAVSMLERLGYRAESAASGEEALDRAARAAFDLLLLDMIMEPGMDGLETFRRVRERTPGQRAVLASGFSETERVREALALGAAAYLKKPFTLRRLAEAVRQALAG